MREDAIEYPTSARDWHWAQALGPYAAYVFFTWPEYPTATFRGTLVTVSLGPPAPCDLSSSGPSSDGGQSTNGSSTPACLTAPPLGTVLATADVPTPPGCCDAPVGYSPDLLLATYPGPDDTPSWERQLAITVASSQDPTWGDPNTYVISAFNVSTPGPGPSSTGNGPAPALVWSSVQPMPYDDTYSLTTFLRLMQLDSTTIAVLIAGCQYVTVHLYDVQTGNKTGTVDLLMSTNVPKSCASFYTDLAVAGTNDGYMAVSIAYDAGLQNVFAGRLTTATNGSSTLTTLWSTDNHKVCGGASLCRVQWPYNSLLLDQSRGIMIRYCTGIGPTPEWTSCVAAIDATTGKTLWGKSLPATASSVSIAAGTGVVTAVINTVNPNQGAILPPNLDVSCFGIDIMTGEELWSWPWSTTGSARYGWSLVDGQDRLLVEKQIAPNVSFVAIDTRTGVTVEESTPYVDKQGSFQQGFGFRGVPFQLGPDGRPYGWIAGVPYTTGGGEERTAAGLAVLRPAPPPPTPTPLPSSAPTASPGPSDPMPASGSPWQVPVAASVACFALLSVLGAASFLWRRQHRTAEDRQALLPVAAGVSSSPGLRERTYDTLPVMDGLM